jgi:YbgC/YbaW family acyl-CoA thioester hydrolase
MRAGFMFPPDVLRVFPISFPHYATFSIICNNYFAQCVISFVLCKNILYAEAFPGPRGASAVSFETYFMIEWGDCDEAGIVFYPNYFYWFDSTYQRWLRSVGLSQRELQRRFNGFTPLVEVGAKFLGPARYDQELHIRAAVLGWDQRRFKIAYDLEVSGKPVIAGFEIRTWAVMAEGGQIRSAMVAPGFKELMA